MEINSIYVNGLSYDIQDSRVTSNMTTAATPSTGGTGGTAGLMSAADKEKLDSIATGATANAGTVTGITIGTGGTNYTPTNGVVTIPAYNIGTVTGVKIGTNGTNYTPTNGIVTIPEYPTVTTYYAPTTTGTAGLVWKSNGSGGEWGSVTVTPTYSDVTYTVYTPSATSGAISINYNNGPVQVITLSGNASSVSASNIPAGHSCHVFFVSNSTSYTRTIAIANNTTSSYCPAATALSLTAPKKNSGYVEVDFINVNDVIYVRGV